jgi:hypothetical protein
MNQENILSGDILKPFFQTFHALTWKGFAWAALLPGLGMLLFYTLALHVRFVLGRWPDFGERLPTQFLSLHEKCVWHFYGALFFSLCAVPFLVIGSVCFRRWRHLSVYFISYAIFAALAGVSILLAPHAFLNWFFD